LDEFINTIINVDNCPAPDQYEQFHLLFEYTTQNTSKGYSNIETCYQHGIERMQDLLVQKVYLTKKKNTKGRANNNQSEDNESTKLGVCNTSALCYTCAIFIKSHYYANINTDTDQTGCLHPYPKIENVYYNFISLTNQILGHCTVSGEHCPKFTSPL
ncbi:26564_t:CDS:2, partial [Gigaspora margarita]